MNQAFLRTCKRARLSCLFLSWALSYLGGSSFLRIPSSSQGVSDPQEEGAETSAEGPGGRTGRSGTWDPWALPGCREADLIAKGPLCKALVNPQSLSPDPLAASAGFAETGRGGCATAGATRPPSALPHPRALARFHSLVRCPGRERRDGLGNKHLCQVEGRYPKKGGMATHAVSHPHPNVSNSNASQTWVGIRIT